MRVAPAEGAAPLGKHRLGKRGDYPQRVAFTLLNKVLDEFLAKHPRSKWAMGQPKLALPELDGYIVKYQDPKQADTIMRVQQELDILRVAAHIVRDGVNFPVRLLDLGLLLWEDSWVFDLGGHEPRDQTR